MITPPFLKNLCAVASVMFLAACATTPDTTDRVDATSQDISSDTYSAVPVRVEPEPPAAAQSASAADSQPPAADADTTPQSEWLVYFDFDQSALTPPTRELLARHATRLTSNSVLVRLEGHADELGTREYNMALGERRAEAVRNYLTSLGVLRSRITIVSYGEEKPESLGSSEAARAKNRRVEIIYNQTP